jgi:hypothetical protein
MTSVDPHDPHTENLGRLVRMSPDPDRAERVRVRCRTRLARGRRVRVRAVAVTEAASHLLPPILGGLCALYAIAFVATMLRLEGLLR